ncbi:hypothetical protein B0H14DRAFT_2642054 [Mycena olivaceomarginata]|nr:hypothetical protein B0H14DRAFT_2642054 [Mycena olivaceomarginata]
MTHCLTKISTAMTQSNIPSLLNAANPHQKSTPSTSSDPASGEPILRKATSTSSSSSLTPPRIPPKFQRSQHKGQYDATLLTESEFHERVEEGSLIETLCCLIPASEEGCVLVHDDDDEMQQRGLIGKGHLQKMRIWADERGQKDLEKR